ncbi:sporulation protein [Microbulbifer echini]|uniref:Sporulation protein n=1 Tax=Microbulbifer echini TaxID=1529067 RepID=A0ABV4NKA2_9GAMM
MDTVLESSSVFQGEVIRGDIHILGGDVEQAIEAISVKVCTQVKVETDSGINYSDFVLDAVQVVDTFTIGVGENRKLRFEIKLNDEVPITVLRARKNQCRVWLETALDIDFALDPKDRNYLEVNPLPVVADIIAMIEQSGFSLVKTDVEKGTFEGAHFPHAQAVTRKLSLKVAAF